MHSKAKLIISCLIIGGLSLLGFNYFRSRNQVAPVIVNHTNAIIAWDFHGVIVQKPLASMLARAVTVIKNADNRWQLIKLLASPSFMSELLFGSVTSCDRTIENFIARFPEQIERHKEEIYEIANMHVLDEAVVDIMEQLKQQGYAQVLASNIGGESLHRMQAKFPHLFEKFEALFYDGPQYPATASNVCTTELKPNGRYYHAFKQFLAQKHLLKEYIVFIDDKKENIVGAQKANVGIDAIQFFSAEQLRKELKKRGIIVHAQKQAAGVPA